MGRIEADIALESWLFGFRPCSGQGQFTLLHLKVDCSDFGPVWDRDSLPFNYIGIRMGVSTTGESGATFPTRILTLEIYWGISQ